MHKQKGFIGLEEIIAATVVIIAVLVALLFVSKSKIGIEASFEEFCKNNPISPICDGKPIDLITGVAAWSTEALACAINSVSTGTADSCLVKFSPEGSGMTSLAIAKNPGNLQDSKFKNKNLRQFDISGKVISGLETGTSGVQPITPKSEAKKEDSGQKTEDSNQFQPATVSCPAAEKYPEIEYVNAGDSYRTLKLKFNGNNWEYAIKSFMPVTKFSEFSPVDKNPEKWPDEYSAFDEKKKFFLEIISRLKTRKEENGLLYLSGIATSDPDSYLIIHYPDGRDEKISKDDQGVIDVNRFTEKTKKENQKIGTCTVKNFNLPQEFGDFIAEDWEAKLGGLGDPQYLVYWQKFPPGEASAWRGNDKWYQNTGTLMFTALCIGSVIAKGVGMWEKVKAIPIRAKDAVVSKAISSRLSTIPKNIRGVADLPEEAFTSSINRKGLAKAVGDYKLNKAIVDKFEGDPNKFINEKARLPLFSDEEVAVKNAFKSIKNGEVKEYGQILTTHMTDAEILGVLNSIGSVNAQKIVALIAAEKFIAYTGITSYIAYHLARWDSEFGKYTDEHPKSIVLQRSMFLNKLRQEYSLGGDEIEGDFMPLGKPVLLKKSEGKMSSQSVPFAMASPCKADITVKSVETKCGSYMYDSINKMAECEDPGRGTYLWGYLDKNPGRKCSTGDLSLGWYDFEFKGPDGITDQEAIRKKERDLLSNMNVELFHKGEKSITSNGKSVGGYSEITNPLNNMKFYMKKDENNNNYRIEYVSFSDGKPHETGNLESDQNRRESVGLCKAFKPINKENEKDIEAIIGGPIGEEGIRCDLGFVVYDALVTSRQLGDIDNGWVDIYLYADTKEDGSLDRFHTIRIDYRNKNSGLRVTILLTDTNGDGILDKFGHYFWDVDILTDQRNVFEIFSSVLVKTEFVDTNSDGKPDLTHANLCSMPATEIEPSQKDYKKGYNFCYEKEWDTAKGAIITTASFAASAAAKAAAYAPLPLFQAVSRFAFLADCGLAYLNYKTSRPWPGTNFG